MQKTNPVIPILKKKFDHFSLGGANTQDPKNATKMNKNMTSNSNIQYVFIVSPLSLINQEISMNKVNKNICQYIIINKYQQETFIVNPTYRTPLSKKN